MLTKINGQWINPKAVTRIWIAENVVYIMLEQQFSVEVGRTESTATTFIEENQIAEQINRAEIEHDAAVALKAHNAFMQQPIADMAEQIFPAVTPLKRTTAEQELIDEHEENKRDDGRFPGYWPDAEEIRRRHMGQKPLPSLSVAEQMFLDSREMDKGDFHKKYGILPHHVTADWAASVVRGGASVMTDSTVEEPPKATVQFIGKNLFELDPLEPNPNVMPYTHADVMALVRRIRNCVLPHVANQELKPFEGLE